MSPLISADWTFKRRQNSSLSLRLWSRWVEISVPYLQEQMAEENKVRIQQEIQTPLFNSAHGVGQGPEGAECSMRIQLTKSKKPRVIQLPTG